MKNKFVTVFLLTVIGITLTPRDISAGSVVRPATNKNLYLSVKSNLSERLIIDAAADEIMEKHVAALGRREAFDSLKSVEIHTEAAVMGNTMRTTRIYDAVGNRTFQKQDSNGRLIEMGFDGTKAWQKAAYFRGFLDASSQIGKSMTRGGTNLPGAGLYNYKTSGKTFTRLPDEEIDGRKYLVVKSEMANEPQTKYYFDPETFLIKRAVSGTAVTQTQTFDDYRKVGGITVAFASATVTPQVTLTSKITELKFNQPLDAAIFEFEEKTSAPAPSAPTESPKTKPLALTADSELSESLRLETFELVWKTVNDTFYDRRFNGVNWQAMHEKYLPLAKTTAKNNDFHQLLNRMVLELRLSHFKVIEPENVATLNSDRAAVTTGTTGLSFAWIDDQLLVAKVKKDSPAALENIRPGFVVKQINGKTPDALYAEYKSENQNFQYRENYARARVVSAEAVGKPETKVSLELLDENNMPHTVELVRQSQSSVRELEFESKKLAGNVGYIKFNLFFGDLLSKFQSALDDFKETKALIIDLRGNPGGAGDLGAALANLLSADSGSLGTLKYRYAEEKFAYKGTGAAAYKGKIFILTNESTGSTSEVFAAGMQANKRALIVGAQSIGAALPSLAVLLPTGGALQYVVSSFQSSNGNTLEAKGVTPDVPVKLSRAALLKCQDEVLEQALRRAGK